MIGARILEHHKCTSGQKKLQNLNIGTLKADRCFKDTECQGTWQGSLQGGFCMSEMLLWHFHTCRWDRVRIQWEWRGGGGAWHGRTQVHPAWGVGGCSGCVGVCIWDKLINSFIRPYTAPSLIYPVSLLWGVISYGCSWPIRNDQRPCADSSWNNNRTRDTSTNYWQRDRNALRNKKNRGAS